ncbi:MAG: RIP metalloprotease RseP [Candidatus Delongbacteria bacterium]|nr:RIP metalloprotease RseP [Candidatus Delongbacteria bacterium]MCG2759964.1 RIP metalloprotease RseP [Candidatus Delongbacteria bacterium]
MLTLFAFIILLGIIVFIHELGHFISAKICGMRAEIFSLGFGKALLKKKFGNTEYRIAWIPLGGYVKISGMMDESMDGNSIKGESYEFESKNFFQKSFVILSGVMMNFLLAIIIYSLITFINGIPEVNSTVIKGFAENSPAEQAGMIIGDVINGVNGKAVHDWRGLTEIIHNTPDKDILVTISRSDSIFIIPVRTIAVRTLIDGEIKTIGLIGIFSETEIKDASILESLKEGSLATWNWIKIGWLSVKMLVTGEASLKDLGGPLLIAQMTGESAKAGIWAYLSFIAFISVNIGFLNVLPVPLLDGGHFMFILYEGVTRRKIPPKVKFRILQTGMLLLFLLMIIVLFNDTSRLLTKENPAEIETKKE